MMEYPPKLVELGPLLAEQTGPLGAGQAGLFKQLFSNITYVFIFVINLCKHFIFIEFFSFCNVSFMGKIR